MDVKGLRKVRGLSENQELAGRYLGNLWDSSKDDYWVVPWLPQVKENFTF